MGKDKELVDRVFHALQNLEEFRRMGLCLKGAISVKVAEVIAESLPSPGSE